MKVQGLREFIALTKDVGRDYANSWQRVAEVYEQKAFYQAIKEQIHPENSRLWIDCCTGTGNLITPNRGIVIGFDYNPESLNKAKQRHQNANYHVEYEFRPDGPPFSFRRIPLNGFVAREGINLVLDDIRTMDVVKEGIKQRPDLMTLTCPGAPECAKYEGKYSQDFNYKPGNINQARERMQKTEDEVIKSFFMQAKEILEGVAVFADRLVAPEGFDLSLIDGDREVREIAEQYGFSQVENRVVERNIPIQEDAQRVRKLYPDQTPLIHVQIVTFRK